MVMLRDFMDRWSTEESDEVLQAYRLSRSRSRSASARRDSRHQDLWADVYASDMARLLAR